MFCTLIILLVFLVSQKVCGKFFRPESVESTGYYYNLRLEGQGCLCAVRSVDIVINPAAIIATVVCVSVILIAISGGLVRHLKALVELEKNPQCIGEPSIQNALLIAESRLK